MGRMRLLLEFTNDDGELFTLPLIEFVNDAAQDGGSRLSSDTKFTRLIMEV
jgi:hypothetical protein